MLLRDPQGKKSIGITAEVNEKLPKKFSNKSLSEVLPKDFWNFVPMVPSHHGKSEPMDISRVDLSPAQVTPFCCSFFGLANKKVKKKPALFTLCFSFSPS